MKVKVKVLNQVIKKVKKKKILEIIKKAKNNLNMKMIV